MKTKRFLSLFLVLLLTLSLLTACVDKAATKDESVEKTEEKTDVPVIYYNDEIVVFEASPVTENGSILVPYREMFEIMGCAVYLADDNGKQIVTAHRGNDSLTLTVGESNMYFNGEEMALETPAKINDGKIFVPLKDIVKALDFEFSSYEDDNTTYVSSTAEAYIINTEKLSETITDEDGNVLVEAVAFYPALDNSMSIPFIDEINEDYKSNAEKFIEEARAKKEDALLLREGIGADNFTPFVFELTYEQTYNVSGEISITNYKYVNVGGVHPSTIMESRSFCIGLGVERSLSDVINEEKLEASLSEYVTNLFVEKLKELDPASQEIYTYDYVIEYIGFVQFYLTGNSVVLYFNQGEIAPYALGLITVEIPYSPELFLVDMRFNCLDEYVFELEYDNGYEWQVAAYADNKLELTEETIEYDPETIMSEHFPVGMKKITVKGIEKGNAGLILAHVKKGEALESATKITITSFYVEDDGKITLVSEDDGMFLLD